MKKPSKSQAELPPIRVRKEPPTVAEAVAAAQDLADDIEQQVEIASGLIGLPPEEVRPHVVAAAAQARPARGPVPSERLMQPMSAPAMAASRAPRTVVVERRSRPAVVVERRGRPLIEPRR